MLAVVGQLTGSYNPAMVNPRFTGYWSGFPPPARDYT